MADFDETRQRFISQWGTLGGGWGINRTMAQIHALLLVSTRPIATQQVMEQLKISRGNANTNLRDLVGWGLIQRVTYPGDRKEYFVAEKDVWKIFCTVARERKRREIEPALQLLRECAETKVDRKDPEQAAFIDEVKALESFLGKADSILERVAKADQNKVMSLLMNRLGR